MASVEDARKIRRLVSNVAATLPQLLSVSNIKAKSGEGDERTRMMVVKIKQGGHVLCTFTPLSDASEPILSEMSVPVKPGTTFPDSDAIDMVVDMGDAGTMKEGEWFEIQ